MSGVLGGDREGENRMLTHTDKLAYKYTKNRSVFLRTVRTFVNKTFMSTLSLSKHNVSKMENKTQWDEGWVKWGWSACPPQCLVSGSSWCPRCEGKSRRWPLGGRKIILNHYICLKESFYCRYSFVSFHFTRWYLVFPSSFHLQEYNNNDQSSLQLTACTDTLLPPPSSRWQIASTTQPSN